VTSPVAVVLTPVRNEAWILERFLRCAEMWADHIVIADQGSVDGSREIARSHSKVMLIDNPSEGYDEGARQRLLLEAARTIPGPRVLFALDADEIMTADWIGSAAWTSLRDARPGTVLRLGWANVLPGAHSCWLPDHDIVFGYVDDGAAHHGPQIHSERLPVSEDAPALRPEAIKVLHYQYSDWHRMKSKQRWYQCWEQLRVPAKRPIQLYRQYHHMDAIPPENVRPMVADWLTRYEDTGIDMRGVQAEPVYPWDEDVLDWILLHGARRFRKIAMWDVDWLQVADHARKSVDPRLLQDPRGPTARLIHRWLAATQARATERRVRLAQRALIPFGW
jgi:glycosyltransferase involved in cell wall biosynthesis